MPCRLRPQSLLSLCPMTVRDNVAAFSELGSAPHVAGLPATWEMATTVMGQVISLPVLISPTGVQAAW